MIEVRIRPASHVDGVHLCTWDADHLDDVIAMVKEWGIDHDTEDISSAADITGQIRITATAAFFEIVVDDGDA